jgi:alpha-1,6-mannosyltransferase
MAVTTVLRGYSTDSPRVTSARLTVALLGGLGLASLGGYALMAEAASLGREPQALGKFVLIFTGLFSLYVAACFLVLRGRIALPTRSTLAVIGVVAVLARGILISSPPTLSNDIYRFVWDGRVMAAGLSPYAYAPGNPAVADLHPPDYWIWSQINRKSAITIYPPGAELFFAGVYRVYPDSVTWTKGAMVLVDLASCVLLLLILGRLGMPRERVLLYAWAPLPIVEFGSSGHVEALSVFCTLAAILVGVVAVQRAAEGGGAGHPASLWALVCLAAAALVKLIPLLLLAGWIRRFGWKFAALCAGLFALVYALFVVATGGYVSNFLVTYLLVEHSNAPVYALASELVARPLGIGDGIVRGVLFAALASVALLVAFKHDSGPYSFVSKSFVLVGAYLILATNAHPWYATWLLLFLPLVMPPGGLLLSGEIDSSENPRLRREYGPALAAFVYTGITFLGYSLFVLVVPTVPLEVSAVQGVATIGLGVVWPCAGLVHARIRKEGLPGNVEPPLPDQAS